MLKTTKYIRAMINVFLKKTQKLLTPFTLSFSLLFSQNAFCMARKTMHTHSLQTQRLVLRAWQDEDVERFYSIMQNPAVNNPLSFYHLNVYENAKEFTVKANRTIAEKGYGYFACIKKDTQECIGFIGLNYIDKQGHPFPCYTISYVLAEEHWGNGYAHEGVSALLMLAFEVFGIGEVHACTTTNNHKSQRVMKRLGMEYVCDFDFPGIDTSAPHCKHVLYKIRNNR